LRVDLARARVQHAVLAASSSHFFDDVACVGDEELMIVRRAFGVVEQRRRAGDRRLELQGIDVDVVPLRKCLIAFAAKRRTGIDQREVDVEDDGLDAAHAEYGPAMTMEARSTERYFFAAAFACSSVTVRSRSGTRAS